MSKQITLPEALLNYRQADEDGVIVKVSRQAIHEAVERIAELEAENSRVRNSLHEAPHHPRCREQQPGAVYATCNCWKSRALKARP